MVRRNHPNKDIEAALRTAEEHGWSVTPKASGHAWGTIRCQRATGLEECVQSIWSTPKNPSNFANLIRRRVRNCPHPDPNRKA